jgi:two-component system sensor histidine kinase UhpB
MIAKSPIACVADTSFPAVRLTVQGFVEACDRVDTSGIPPRTGALSSGRSCRFALAARQEERARISRELHDDLGQRLLALRLDLQLMCRSAARQTGIASQADLLRALAGVDDSLEAVRRIAANLRPAGLEGIGLAEAMHRLAQEWSDRCGLRIQWLAGFPEDLQNDSSSELSWALYRMAQESLANVARHAQAREVWLRLVRQGDEVVFTVEDDGCGATLGQGRLGKRPGLGLQGLAERFSLLGGCLRMIDGELGGCRLEARVPWPVARATGSLPPDHQAVHARSTH